METAVSRHLSAGAAAAAKFGSSGRPNLEEMAPQRRFDDLIVCGRYVTLFCTVCEVVIFSQCASMFYFVFAGAAPPIDTLSCNDNPLSVALTPADKCALFMAGNCSNPRIDYQFRSVNVEFNLLCGKATEVKNVISLQMLGVLLGSVVFGQFSDSFGRKKTVLVALTGCGVCSIVSALCASVLQFTAVRVVCGFFLGGSIAVFNVFWVENLPKKSRLWISMIITWSPNFAPFAVLAYFFESWSSLAVTLGVIMITGAALLFFFVHESPRWLIQKGRINEGREIMLKVFKMDGRCVASFSELEDILLFEHEEFERKQSKAKHYFYYHLFSTCHLATITCVLSFTFFILSVINYGIMFNFEQLSGSIYLNMVYTGLIRWVANWLFALLDWRFKWCGRKIVHAVGMIFIIVPLIIVIGLQATGKEQDFALLERLAILVAVSMTSQVYVSATVVSSEIFPTPIRNLAYSFQSLFNRLGVVMSPFVFTLSSIWIGVPFIVMTVGACIDMCNWQFQLSESKGAPMIEHMPRRKQQPETLLLEKVTE